MLATLSTFDPKDVLPHCNKADHTLSILQWPKRVNHKSVSQNTNQFSKTQSNFLKHKSVYQNAQKFCKTQINFPKHKSVYQNAKQFLKTQTNFQNTNQFTKTQINFSKHKPISRNTKQKIGNLPCTYQRAWKGLIPKIFRLRHGDFYYVLPQLWV